MKYDVFISYSYRNKAEADAICAGLEQDGIRCWYAPRDIVPGDTWAEAIVTGIESAKIMVVVVTDSSVQSRQVLNEISCAVTAGVTIIPFRLTSSELSKSMKYYFSSVHWLDAVNKPLADSILDLRNRVQLLLGSAQASPSAPAGDSRSAPAARAQAPAAPASPQGKPAEPAVRHTPRPSSPALSLATAPMPAPKNFIIPYHVGIDIGDRSFSWGYLDSHKRLISETIPLSDNLLKTIPASERTGRIVQDVLSYIKSRTSYFVRMPFTCVAAVPSLSYRDLAQVNQTASSLGVTSASAIKRVSAAALSLFDSLQDEAEDSYTLVIEYSGSSCGTAIAQIGDGIVEIISAVQRQFSPEAPFSFDLLRKDIYKNLDTSSVKNITHIFVSGLLPASCQQQLESLFRVPCVQLPPESVLRGLTLLAGLRSGDVKDVLLLDATDFDVCVGTQILIPNATTIPVTEIADITYRTARTDHCIDIYIRKNNLVLDTPLTFRLPVEKILDPNRDEQQLKVTCSIQNEFAMSFIIRNPDSGKEVKYSWNEIRNKLIASP